MLLSLFAVNCTLLSKPKPLDIKPKTEETLFQTTTLRQFDTFSYPMDKPFGHTVLNWTGKFEVKDGEVLVGIRKVNGDDIWNMKVKNSVFDLSKDLPIFLNFPKSEKGFEFFVWVPNKNNVQLKWHSNIMPNPEKTKLSNIVPLKYPISDFFIAHGLGLPPDSQGIHLLNTKQGFHSSYSKGFKYFESDLSVTSDNKLIAFHDGNEALYKLRFGFNLEEFQKVKLFNHNEPLTGIELINLMIENPQWILITDTKSQLIPTLKQLLNLLPKNIHPSDRIIPQIYEPKDYNEIRPFKFSKIIFTLYRSAHLNDDQILDFVSNKPDIWALTVPPHRLTNKLIEGVQKMDIRLFTHTINDPTLAHWLLNKGIGIYTDFLFPLSSNDSIVF